MMSSGHFKHPKTWAVYGTRLTTDVGGAFPRKKPKSVDPQQEDKGDLTVPAASAKSLFGKNETYTGEDVTEFI
jgi:hypothetical protein